MVRQAIATIGLLLLVAVLPPTTPARAQFDTIFGNDRPPRPPANIPGSQQQQPGFFPGQQPQQQPDFLPPVDEPRTLDPRDDPSTQAQQPRSPQPLRPTAGRDEPPAQPMPSPMNLPPLARPGGGSIESQPLAPPPGTEPAQQANTPNTVNPNAPAPQQQQPGTEQQANQPPAGQPPATPGNPPAREVVVEPPPQRITNPTAVFEGLDKVTGRITSFNVAVNETVQFGALQVTPKACYSRPPTETPQTDAFINVDEVTLKGDIKRIFTGWMFKASPGLHAVEHPIYDVWLIDCKGGKNPDVADASDATADDRAAAGPSRDAEPAKPAPRQAPPPRPSTQSRGFLPALR